MKRRWILGGGVGIFVGAFLLAGAATSASKPLQRSTPRSIEAIAMDGSRVAYDVAGGSSNDGRKYNCNAVYVWNLDSGTVTRVSGKRTCAADTTSTGTGVSELAIAGGRTAWIVNTGGNSESEDVLFTGSLRPGERRLAAAVRTRGADSGVLTGDWIGGLVGAGPFLGVNRWTTDLLTNVTSASLQAIGPGLRTIASGTETRTAGATDGRQIAVLQSGRGPQTDDTVALYSTTGRLLRVVAPRSVEEVALRGDYLTVLTRAGTLVVRVVATTKKNGPGIVGVELEPRGLVYATNYVTRSGRPARWGVVGRLFFIPMAQLR